MIPRYCPERDVLQPWSYQTLKIWVRLDSQPNHFETFRDKSEMTRGFTEPFLTKQSTLVQNEIVLFRKEKMPKLFKFPKI